MAKNVVTPIGILCFADQLFNPKVQENAAPGAKPRYSAMLLFDDLAVKSTAYQDLRKAVQEAAAEKFGASKAMDPAFMRSLRLPFRNADEKQYDGFDKGVIYISPWSAAKPGVVDLHGTEILVPEDVWSGQLARATVRAFAYDSNGNKGISFGLEHVQIVKKDMPRIDGRRAPTAAFSGAPVDDEQMKALGIDPNTPAPAAASAGLPW
jgi:hypothetical protein